MGPMTTTSGPRPSPAPGPDPALTPTGGSRGPEAPRKRGPYRTGIRRRAEIIEAATAVFGEHGFAGATLAQIAAGVGVSPQAIVKHFGSKEGLLTAVLEASDAHNARLHFADLRGLEYFDASGRLVRHNMRNRGLVELLLTVAAESTGPSHPARDHMVARYRRFTADTAGRLREARDAGEIGTFTDEELEVEARGYIALMDGLELQWLLDPSFDLGSAWDRHYMGLRERWIAGPRSEPGS